MSVETCRRSVIICQLIVHLLVVVQNKFYNVILGTSVSFRMSYLPSNFERTYGYITSKPVTFPLI
jgi:hypothetical protein